MSVALESSVQYVISAVRGSKQVQHFICDILEDVFGAYRLCSYPSLTLINKLSESVKSNISCKLHIAYIDSTKTSQFINTL